MRYRTFSYLVLFFGLLTACSHSQTDSSLPNTASTILPVSTPSPPEDLWQAMRDRFQLEHNRHKTIVQQHIQALLKHKQTFLLHLEKSIPYLQYILTELDKKHLPAELALLPYIESRYEPMSYSKVGAGGYWQMMPGTASGFGLKINWWYDGRRDLFAATEAAIHYLTYLERYFNHNWLLAIAAYDAGEGTVRNAISHLPQHKASPDFWLLPLPQETQNYVPKLLALASIIDHPDEYQVVLPPAENRPYLRLMSMPHQVEFREIARLSSMNMVTLQTLNPAFKRWVTDPDGPHRLWVPEEISDTVAQKLADYQMTYGIIWYHHRVASGETLAQIAKRYSVSVASLKQVNRLSSNTLSPDQNLLIPKTDRPFPTSYVPNHGGALAAEKRPGPRQIYYQVRKGDTLTKVAQRYSITPAEIRFWNHLPADASLKPGSELILWTPTRVTSTVVTTSIPEVDRYQVIAGDSLKKVADRFGVTLSRLKQLNRLQKDILRPGTLLNIPLPQKRLSKTTPKIKAHTVHYQVRPGESLVQIAKKHQLSVKELQEWNRLTPRSILRANQLLTIYR